jgi:rhodanese-related sulfurtransferase/transcriptional regulator with XRE-family HTH domain
MVRNLAPREAQELILSGGLDVVDVREPNEWATGHVPGARLVPLGQLRSNPDDAHLGDKVLFICERGGRSRQAAELAEVRGTSEVSHLEGGVSGWRQAGLPIVVPEVAVPETGGVDDSTTPEIDAVVSENVKRLRAQRGYTLDVLAGLSGVARHTLGQIEIGRAVPNLGTLWKIARAFEIPFSALLVQPAGLETRIFRRANAKRIVDADGRFSSRALFSQDDKAGFEFYELFLAGHSREDAEPHAPGTRENLLVTAGRLVLELGKERFELGKGDAIAFTADVPHAYLNPATEECWMTLVMTYTDGAPARASG